MEAWGRAEMRGARVGQTTMFKKRTVQGGQKRRHELTEETGLSSFSPKAKAVKRAAAAPEPVAPVHRASSDEPPEMDEKPKVAGPKGAPRNVRVTTLTDFQPDVCKDFLQTGYCGYGDTCKFLHIRDELRAKRPVEKEWETVGQGNGALGGSLAGSLVGSLAAKPQGPGSPEPFRCPICKDDYKSPVRTACGHKFCRACFMGRFRAKKRRCFVCKKDTGGVATPVEAETGPAKSGAERTEAVKADL